MARIGAQRERQRTFNDRREGTINAPPQPLFNPRGRRKPLPANSPLRVEPLRLDLQQLPNVDASRLPEIEALFPVMRDRTESSRAARQELKTRIGRALLPASTAGKIDALRKQLPDVEIGQDATGRLILLREGRMAVINKEGPSMQDFRDFWNNVVPGTPFGILGALLGFAIGGPIGFGGRGLLAAQLAGRGLPHLVSRFPSPQVARQAGRKAGEAIGGVIGGLGGGGLLRDEVGRQAGSRQRFESFDNIRDVLGAARDGLLFDLLLATGQLLPELLTRGQSPFRGVPKLRIQRPSSSRRKRPRLPRPTGDRNRR